MFARYVYDECWPDMKIALIWCIRHKAQCRHGLSRVLMMGGMGFLLCYGCVCLFCGSQHRIRQSLTLLEWSTHTSSLLRFLETKQTHTHIQITHIWIFVSPSPKGLRIPISEDPYACIFTCEAWWWDGSIWWDFFFFSLTFRVRMCPPDFHVFCSCFFCWDCHHVCLTTGIRLCWQARSASWGERAW